MANRPPINGIDIGPYQERKKLCARLTMTLRTFCKWYEKDSLLHPSFCRALESLTPPPFCDSAKLSSIYAGKGSCSARIYPARAKQYLLLVSIHFVVKQWWDYLEGNQSMFGINHCINYLEAVADKGMVAYVVVGTIKRGYRLREIKNGYYNSNLFYTDYHNTP